MTGNKVIKAGVGYTVGNYLLKGLSFLTIPIFARILSTEDYGIVNTFGSYESILFVIIGLAIHSSFKNARYKYGTLEEGAKQGSDYGTYVSNAYLFIIINALIWFTLAFFFRFKLAELLKIEPSLVLLLVINSSANAIVVAFNSDTSIRYEYGRFLGISFFNAITNIVVSILLIRYVFPENKYIGRIIGTVVPIVLAGGFVAFMQIRRSKPNQVVSMIKWGLKYSIPIVPHGISQIILSSFDRIMITRMVSAAASGVYSFAYNVFVIVSVTATSIDTVWNPWFYERRRQDDYEAIRKYSSIYTLFLAFFCFMVMLLSPEIIRILGGTKYNDSIYCVIPIVAGGFFTMLYNIPATVEYYHEKTGKIATATITAAVMNILLNYVFIRKYGYVAAAYTTLATYFLYYCFHYFMSVKIERKSLFSQKIILLSAFMVLSGSAFSILLMKHFLIRLMIALIFMSGFIILEEKELALLKKLKKRLKKGQ